MMFFASLKDLIFHHKDDIIQEMKHRLAKSPRCRHREFALLTKEGDRRFKIWVDLVIKSLNDNHVPFLIDQAHVGYLRAINGFEFEFAFPFYNTFHQVVYEILNQAVSSETVAQLNLYDDLRKLNETLLQGFSTIAASFLKTREELITQKVSQFKELYNFTKEMIKTFQLEEIASIVLKRTIPLFGVERGSLSVYRDRRLQGFYGYPVAEEAHDIISIMNTSWKENATLFMNEEGNVHREINRFHLKRIVSVPIYAHDYIYGAFALADSRGGFKFTEKELNLLNQFLYITAITFENTFMVEEIQQSRRKLSLLTGRMITLQEEERKRLASDIHDTIAQTLTGISYKIQLCKELARKNPDSVIERLDTLIETVDKAIDQSRELISDLRPDLLDTVGLVPALKHFIESYSTETGIKVLARLPKQVKISSDIKICLFRVAQEALTNIYKHAFIKTAEVIVRKEDGQVIMAVVDNGKGFDMSLCAPWTKDQSKLGLLSMKERVEALGGTLLIHSKIHEGCKIEAKIPFKQKRRFNE